MANLSVFSPRYSGSRALIVGINKYAHAPPLAYARNDAEAMAQTLIEKFAFPKQNVTTLLDDAATRDAIMSAFLGYAGSDAVEDDDRILFFFAGHGHTITGRRGETGYLVPVDGNVVELATLIRWDELTRNADLITAKHMLFIMDACYGGLALSRRVVPAGSMRFVKDMLQRYSRQVLTAGKADEVVADSGGPRRGHSIFTGHLLDGLEGLAVPASGVMTANALMAHVYSKVSAEANSQQTPHYGFIEGDGDFIFDTAALDALQGGGEKDNDLLIEVSPSAVPEAQPIVSVAERMKDFLSDSAQQIRMDDYVSAHVRRARDAVGMDRFPLSVNVNAESFATRLRAYEAAIADLETVTILIARWATTSQISVLEKVLGRLSEVEKAIGGPTVWLNLYWYPIHLLMYSAGIAALSADRFDVLRAIINVRTRETQYSASSQDTLLKITTSKMVSLADAFKVLPGHDRQYVPRSEYIFKQVQPALEDLLFLGLSYEDLFDRLEILLALSYADQNEAERGGVWGPPGRFAWKHSGNREGSPYSTIITEATRMGNAWGPIQAGMFGGSIERFMHLATDYKEKLDKLTWW